MKAASRFMYELLVGPFVFSYGAADRYRRMTREQAYCRGFTDGWAYHQRAVCANHHTDPHDDEDL